MIKKKHITLQAVLLVILFLAALFVFCYIADETIHEKEERFDININTYRVAHTGPAIVSVMKVLTWFGTMQFLLTAYIIMILVILLKKNYRFAIAIIIIAIGAWAVTIISKKLFHRSRPDLPLVTKLTNYSFPSGHAFSSFIFCCMLSYIVWHSRLQLLWKWMINVALLLFTLSIGLSRIILNVHYTTDVIGGFSLGIMWMILMYIVFKNWLRTGKVLHT